MEAAFVKALREAKNSDHTVTMLDFMRHHGSSVSLSWGEDTGLWECYWITGGDRFGGASGAPADACRIAMENLLHGNVAHD